MPRARHGGDHLQIDQFQQRIAGAFDPDHPGFGGQHRFQGRPIPQVGIGKAQAGAAAAHLLEQAAAAAINIVQSHQMIARIQQLQHRRGRRQPRREGEAGLAALQIGHATLVGKAGRVLAARILEALVHARTGLHVGGCRINRRDHRAGSRIGRLAGVHGAGGETERTGGIGHDGNLAMIGRWNS